MANRYCFALDLKNDPQLIAEYELHHKAVWPEVLRNMREIGILDMEIYRTGTRLFMTLETNDDFSIERKALADAQNASTQAWETLMWKYQQALPNSAAGEKWVPMKKIFSLKDQP